MDGAGLLYLQCDSVWVSGLPVSPVSPDLPQFFNIGGEFRISQNCIPLAFFRMEGLKSQFKPFKYLLALKTKVRFWFPLPEE